MPAASPPGSADFGKMITSVWTAIHAA